VGAWLLRELVANDLECRWSSDPPGAGIPDGTLPDRPRLEDYTARYPELGPPETLPLDLVVVEYRVRHRWGEQPTHAAYLTRFPAHGPALTEALSQADAELALERPPLV
jgi:hypothetical protein